MSIGSYATRWRQAAPLARGIGGRTRGALRDIALYLSSGLDRRQNARYLRCLYCHYVFDDQLEAFERLIIKLKSIAAFVDTDTCVQMLHGQRKIDARYFHLSFDDGFRNNYTNALPILKRHNIPAIFFVPSSLIGGGWEVAEQYCLHTTSYRSVIEMMHWDEVEDLQKSGYEIGSHTRTHARFSDISGSPDLLRDQILGSKLDLEDRLGRECKYISWPFGTLADADASSLAVVRQSGYLACFGAYRGTVRPGITDAFSIPRHHFEAEWPTSHIAYFARGGMESAQ